MDIKDKKFHFIAIGGVGMSALAIYLLERDARGAKSARGAISEKGESGAQGVQVSGSDMAESKYTHLLEEKGAKVYIGHSADLIEEDMVITASSAIGNDNPEIIRAKELGLKIYHRSDILKMISDEYSLNENSYFIGFSGTHGKTTTSGLASYVLEKALYLPSYVVGGIIPEINTNGRYGGDKYFCAELDESDGTIEKYATDIAVINNMDEDHLDYYVNGFSDIAKTFNKYLSNNPSQKVVINVDNSGNRKFMELYPQYNYITFGLDNADYTAKNIKTEGFSSSFDLYKNGKLVTTIDLSILGLHNVYNALAVAAGLTEAGIEIERLKEHFKNFSGMGRRFQKVGEFNGIKIFDDYAHHPNEIKTTLTSLKNAVKNTNRIVAIFQPHRYSRLKNLWEDFKQAFDNSDLLLVTDVYSAGETYIEGVTGENFAKDMSAKYIAGNMEQAAEVILPMLKPDDIVITLGAGSITQLGRNLLRQKV